MNKMPMQYAQNFKKGLLNLEKLRLKFCDIFIKLMAFN